MSEISSDFSTAALIAAIKANLFEYFEYLGRSAAAEFHVDPCLKWVFTGIPNTFLNNIYSTRLSPDIVDESIRQILAGLGTRNITKLSWWAGPGTQPEDLGEHLVRHGLIYDPGEPGMAADLMKLNEVAAPPGLIIKQVVDAKTLREYVHAAATGFGLPETSEEICFDLFASLGFDPPLINIVGYLGGQPVATAESFLGAGVAGIYWVSTVPEARHKGIGSAMTHVLLRQACDMGYRIGILHSSDQGLEIYRQLGFVEKCRMSHYVWTGEGAVG